MSSCGYIYILSSQPFGTLYIGVTSNLEKRIYEHKNHVYKGFTSQYKVTQLVYYEVFEDIVNAIEREKNLKNWQRQWKINLIERENPHWIDLSINLFS